MRISSSTSLITSLPHYGDITDLTQCFQWAREAGFDYMDVSLANYCFKDLPMTGDHAEQWAEQQRMAADALGLTIHQTHGHALSGTQWDDPACELQSTFIERNLRCIRATKILGAEWMVLHPANLPHAPLYSAQKAKEANLNYLAPLIEEAKRQGVGLAIENMVDFGRNQRRYCGGDPYELLDLVDTINDPAVGICVDTGHAHQAGLNVGDFIRLAGSRLKATHIDDNHRDKDSHLIPFYGTADWKDIADALKEIHYQNDFSFELNFVKMPAEAVVPWLHFIHELGKSIIR
ncbi:MAG: sugar phosphate isomerase/epimerase [Clostridia bacterium]|nr:sugar phosphate isomerase/epimerase [Clostridia bacterium]